MGTVLSQLIVKERESYQRPFLKTILQERKKKILALRFN
jgi:hypothetical protein